MLRFDENSILSRRRAIAALCVAAVAAICTARLAGGAEQEKKEQWDMLTAKPEVVKAWQDMRFGMFVCWGPVSLTGKNIGWSRGGKRPNVKGKGTGEIPVEIYDNLYKQFNPVKFDAQQWAQIAKDAGMKYLVFLTKHHDGFCMFDSKLTDYKITSPLSPFGRDITKEVAEAFRKAGIWVGFYYSPPDWHHPDYLTENNARYIKYYYGQIEELCSNYGKVNLLWLDGGCRDTRKDREGLFKRVRQLQPQMVFGRGGAPLSDYDTPEQEIGQFQTDRPWETCMTITEHTWSWIPDVPMWSLKHLLQTLVRVAGNDGNFLLNVGPMPDGRINPPQAQRLRDMGRWLKRYGQSIYATRGGPFKLSRYDAPTYASTHKDTRIYVHILDWPGQRLCLPPIDKKIVRSWLLTGGLADVQQPQAGITIAVAKEHRRDIDTILVLELDGPAGRIAPVSMPSKSLARHKKARASNVRSNNPPPGPDKAFDDDDTTRWAMDKGTTQAWLEVDLGKPCTISRAVICQYISRVRQYELQRKVDGKWQAFHRGTQLDRHREVLDFKPVTARYVRLNVLRVLQNIYPASIWEFQLFAPEE